MSTVKVAVNADQRRSRPFRRAVYGGLSLVVLPLATIAILIWLPPQFARARRSS
jgi:hypothetical protein